MTESVPAGTSGTAAGPARRRPRILLAEPRASERAHLRRLLARRWAVEAVADGSSALEAARARPPDLLLADARLGGWGGAALARALRDDPRMRLVPVVLLADRRGDGAEGRGSEAVDVLRRPVASRQLVAILERLCPARSAEEPAGAADRLGALGRAALANEGIQTLAGRLQVITDHARELTDAREAVTTLSVDNGRTPAITSGSASERDAAWPGDERPPTQEGLAVPLVGDDGRDLGLVQLRDKRGGAFTAEDEAVLRQLAQLASLAVENAQRYEAQEHGRRSAERAAERLSRLQRLTAALARALTPAEVAQAIVREGRPALGAAAAIVAVRSDDACEVLAAEGYPDAEIAAGSRFPLAARVPLAEVMRTGEPVWLESGADWEGRFLGAHAGHPTGAGLPLRVGDTTIGALGFRFPDEVRPVPEAERAFVGALAELCAQSLERARLYAAEQSARASEERRRRQAEMLADASEAVSMAVAPETAPHAVARVPVPGLADVCCLYLDASPGPMRLIAVASADPAVEGLVWETRRRHAADPGHPDPLAAVLRSDGPALLADLDAELPRPRGGDGRDPDWLRRIGARSLLVVPLPGPPDRPAGAMALLLTGAERRFAGDDVAVAEELGRRAGLAIERVTLLEAERAARQAAERAVGRVERLQELTAALSGSLTAEEVAAATVGQAIEALDADGGWVALFDEEDATLRLAAAEGCPREVIDVLRCQHADRSVPTAEAVRTGRPIWLSGRAEVELRAPQLARADPEARSLALLPVRTDGRTLAAAGLRFTAERRLEPSDQVYALALARLCAQALERALRYEREREVAEILQRSLLPRELAQLPGAEVAMRYLPAVDGIAVGGDWYESIELPGGRVGLAVGDVVGRGVEAAAVMGQLRSAMRAFALDGDPPHRVLERLSRFAAGIEGGRATTVAYAIVDPESGDLRYACAGHPPPLVVAPDGTAGYLVDGRSVPLAAGLGDDSYREGRSSLGVGSTLVLYSDGAIERRGESVDAGLGWLRQTVATAPEVDPESLCTHLLERLSDERPPRDDVALVALRLSPRPATPLALSAPADPSRVSGVRRTVLTWLERSGLAGQTAHDIVLACGEACANAAEHAYADGEDGAVEVEVHGEGADEIVLRVRDFGRWRPPPDDPGDRGRGFLIMRQVMDGLEVVSGPDGTEVVMRRRVGPIARGGDAEAGSREEGAPAAAPAVDGPRAALARLVVERVAGRTVAHLGGEVDASNAADLGVRLLGTLEGAGSGLVVDLSDLAYLDSAGIRMVGELARRSRGAVRLLLPPESLLRGILEIASIEAIAPVVQSLDEAADPAGA